MTESYEISKDDKLGRFLVAGKPLKKGTLIFSDVPFSLGPKPESPPVCLGCHKAWNGVYKCSQCNWPCCNSTCERLSIHRNNECKVFAESNAIFHVPPKNQPCLQYDCITPLRILLTKQLEPEKWKNEVKIMEDHNCDRKNRPSWEVDQINVVNYLRGPCELSERFSEELIQKVCGILEVNAVEVPLLHGPNLRAIYPKVAVMSHNCVPSIVHIIVNGGENDLVPEHLAQVWAARDLECGEKLELCYTNVLQATIQRRDFLKASKFFDCDCMRCRDPTELGTEMSTLLCSKCDDGFVRAIDPLDFDTTWSCSKCTYTTTSSDVRRLLLIIQNEISLAEKCGMGPVELENIEQLMKWLSGVLHPKHSIFISLRYSLLHLYGNVRGYELESLPITLLKRKASLCQQVISVLDIISPGQTRIRGTTLYELHSALFHLSREEYKGLSINDKELKEKTQEVVGILWESGTILSREDEDSEKGILGREALKIYKSLITT